jgi:hypothetical protein
LIQNSETLTSLEFIYCKLSPTFVSAICGSLNVVNTHTHGIQHFSINTSSFLEINPVSLPPGFVSFLSSGRYIHSSQPMLCSWSASYCMFFSLISWGWWDAHKLSNLMGCVELSACLYLEGKYTGQVPRKSWPLSCNSAAILSNIICRILVPVVSFLGVFQYPINAHSITSSVIFIFLECILEFFSVETAPYSSSLDLHRE